MDDLTILAHIVCIAGIIILSLSGSIFSIHHYSKKRPLTKASTFIISLAILDVFASIFVVQVPFILYYRHLRDFHGYIWPRLVFRSITRFVNISYLLILASIAVDRVCAVYRPYEYKNYSTYIIKVIILELIFASLSSAVAEIIQQKVVAFDDSYIKMFLMSVICILFLTLLMSYFLIVRKLRRQRMKVGAAPINIRKPANSVPSIALITTLNEQKYVLINIT